MAVTPNKKHCCPCGTIEWRSARNLVVINTLTHINYGQLVTPAILLYSPCAFKCQIYLLLNTEFTELISFILNREAIQFGKWTFVDICKRFEEHIRHWTFIFFAENHSHRLYVNKERVDCEFSLCASDCATVLYFCGPWPYGL